ncbi:NUDIX domain-containing protein [Bacillus cereus]
MGFAWGRLEENEQLEKCAIRETKEETGYLIVIERKIGNITSLNTMICNIYF